MPHACCSLLFIPNTQFLVLSSVCIEDPAMNDVPSCTRKQGSSHELDLVMIQDAF